MDPRACLPGRWSIRMGIGREVGVGYGVIGADPARPRASSCQLRSGISPVPKSEDRGTLDVVFWGVEAEATAV